MFKHIFFCFFLCSLLFAKKNSKDEFKLPPAIGGGQTGWLNVERLPTSIKINDEWVLPRGGTMEWLMSKGYVPDSENSNTMKPNPFDKRYKAPRNRQMPSLATTPLEYIYVPKPKKTNDPFAGLAEPLKRQFSPLPEVGIKDDLNNPNDQGGPLLNLDLPDLKNSPFAEPKLPIADNPKIDPFNQKNKPGLPPNDPFSDDVLNNPRKELDPNKLPGRSIPVRSQDNKKNLPVKPNA